MLFLKTIYVLLFVNLGWLTNTPLNPKHLIYIAETLERLK